MPAAECLLMFASTRMSLTAVDMAIIVLYFSLVLGLGVYLRRFTNTGDEFFMAGH